MKVFKFGGASIKNAAAIKNVASIIKKYRGEKLLVVVSAMGKTTNALENVLDKYIKQDKEQLQEAVHKVKQQHQQILEALFEQPHPIYDEINDTFVDMEWILEEDPQESYDYLYDQVVSTGELLSTKIVAAYLNQVGVETHWLDVRDCILTDNNYREAGIHWSTTTERIEKVVPPLLENKIVLTQGFIGCTTENFTTTLGREGSDFTAAIFSYGLDAESMSIWKDVPGVLTGDPRLFDNRKKLEQLSYAEAIEMTYYGAQVIHPKTIRPLQNKAIPLHVKSFVNPEGSGTTIGQFDIDDYPPMIVVKTNQALLKITSKDFYFVDEAKFSALFAALAHHRVKVNMTQNTALAFSVCVNDDAQKIEALIADLQKDYTVGKIEQLKLITIRYTTSDLFARFTKDQKVYLEEKIRNTTQLVVDESVVIRNL